MTIFYTLIRENVTKKLISADFSPESINTSIGNNILKELRDTKTDGELNKLESSDPNICILYIIMLNIFFQ